MTNSPNLFNFATSELSHDAMIAWLCSWADPVHAKTHSELHQLGTAQLRSMLQKHGQGNLDIEHVDVIRQYKNIDVLIEVNIPEKEKPVPPQGRFIIIENKLFTRNHSDQLNRYRKTIEENEKRAVNEEQVLGVYYKVIEQPKDQSIDSAKFVMFDRSDILQILANYAGPNSPANLVHNYRDWLLKLDHEVKRYATLPVKDWNGIQWQGFLSFLHNELIRLEPDAMKGCGWGYVANPSGGFWGMWFGGIGDYGRSHYVQIESNHLCIKQEAESQTKEVRNTLKWEWMDNVINTAKEMNIPFAKPPRVVPSKWFTVAKYRQTTSEKFSTWIPTDREGIIELDKTVNLLLKSIELVRTAHSSWKITTRTVPLK